MNTNKRLEVLKKYATHIMACRRLGLEPESATSWLADLNQAPKQAQVEMIKAEEQIEYQPAWCYQVYQAPKK